MPIKLSDIQKKTKSLSISFQGETLLFDYLINVVTPAFLNDKLDLKNQLVQSIAKWDLETDDGKTAEISVETFDQLPVQFQIELMTAITEDMKVVSTDEKND